MKIPTFYVEDLTADQLALSETEAKHARVLRVKSGDTCFLVTDHGQKAQGHWVKNNHVEIVKRFRMARPFGEVSWMIPFIAPEDLKTLVQAGTTLGVVQIDLVQTDLTQQTRRDPERVLNKLQKAVVSAQKVASIPYQPKLYLRTLEETLQAHQGPGLVLHQAASETQKPQKIDNPLLCIGPEGGFTAAEMAFFRQRSFPGVSLGHVNYPTTLAPIIATLWWCG